MDLSTISADSDYARKAYFDMRFDVAPGSPPLPPWNELRSDERELLVRMFILGAKFMANALTTDAKKL